MPKPLPPEVQATVRFLARERDDARREAERNRDFYTLHYDAAGRADGFQLALVYLAGTYGYTGDPVKSIAVMLGDCRP